MAKVLYRKYRSKSLSEIVGQEHITKTLSQAIKTNRLSHAYLFTGPKGVGKTSVARILAHEVNKLPYTSDEAQIDIIEIDAASNRRIDEIRHLRDRVYISPSSSPYKVYIIDEVHMLTKEAFNALLKTLEEPPEHVIFILATTDANKLPETIISRTQRFNFKPADNASIVNLLKSIAKSEKIAIEDNALELIAEHGKGSYRDSIGILDQLSSHEQKITTDDVSRTLGLPRHDLIEKIIESMEKPQGSYRKLVEYLSQLEDAGTSPGTIASSLMDEIRTRMLSGKLDMPKNRSLALLKELLQIDSSSDPSALLEITILDHVSLDANIAPEVEQPEKPVAKVKEVEPEKQIQEVSPLDQDNWQKILDSLKSKHNTLYGIARMANPIFGEDKTLVLVFDFQFHQKKLKESKNKDILLDAIKSATGEEYNIDFRLNENKGVNDSGTPDIENINKIFGQTELID